MKKGWLNGGRLKTPGDEKTTKWKAIETWIMQGLGQLGRLVDPFIFEKEKRRLQLFYPINKTARTNNNFLDCI